MQRRVSAAGIVGMVVVLDVVTKQLVLRGIGRTERIHVLGPLDLVRRTNRGGAFSIAAEHGLFPWIVSALVAGLVVWFVRALVRSDPRLRGAALVAVSLLVGGALGNQIDRWFRAPGWNRGAVVDFLDVGFWPVFNVADSALVCGAIAIALLSLRAPEPTEPTEPTERGGTEVRS